VKERRQTSSTFILAVGNLVSSGVLGAILDYIHLEEYRQNCIWNAFIEQTLNTED
jgi:hypothetical protein